MKKLLVFTIWIPFFASSQFEEDSVHFDSKTVSFPASIQQFELLRGFDLLDNSVLHYSFTPTKSENKRAL